MTPNANPITGGFERQMNVLAGFQLGNSQPAGTSNSHPIEDSVLAASVGKHPRIDDVRIEGGINAGHVLADESLETAFGSRAVERVAGFARPQERDAGRNGR